MSPVAWIFAAILLVTAVFAVMFWVQVRRIRADLVQSEAVNVQSWVDKEQETVNAEENNRSEGEAWERFRSHTE